MALGLVMAIAMPAAAVDVKVSGSWYMAGWYADNPSGLDKSTSNVTDTSWGGGSYSATDPRHKRGATAYYTHRLSLKPEIQIVEGLKVVTSMDILESVIGDNTWKGSTGGRITPQTTTRGQGSTATGAALGAGVLAQENIEINEAYVDFKTRYGQFKAGMMANPTWGTRFIDNTYVNGRIVYTNVQGPMTYMAQIIKAKEWKNRSSYGLSAYNNGLGNDSDQDIYKIAGIYKFKAGEVGMEYEYWRDAKAKTTYNVDAATAATDGTTMKPTGNTGWVTALSTINPYTKLRFGNFYVEGEAYYRFGNLRKYEQFTTGNTQQPDIAVSAWGAYLDGRYDFKPAYGGAKFIYMSGDDLQANDKVTGSIAQLYGDGYTQVAQTLILWNFDYNDPMGGGYGLIGNIDANGVNPRTGSNYRNSRFIDNVWLYQIYGGMNITPKLNVEARLTYATADKKPKMGVGTVGEALTANNSFAAVGTNQEFVSDKYGTEVDLSASYKIYDNLTYSVGAGYLWVGDYFKGYSVDAKLKDNYILTHKLTLAF